MTANPGDFGRMFGLSVLLLFCTERSPGLVVNNARALGIDLAEVEANQMVASFT
jgi:hypothetical protein